MTATNPEKPWYDPARVEEVARRLCALDYPSGRNPDAPYYPGTPYIHRGGFMPVGTEAQPLWTAYAEDARRALRVILCPAETEL